MSHRIQLACILILYVSACVNFSIVIVHYANAYVVNVIALSGPFDALQPSSTPWFDGIQGTQGLITSICVLIIVCAIATNLLITMMHSCTDSDRRCHRVVENVGRLAGCLAHTRCLCSGLDVHAR